MPVIDSISAKLVLTEAYELAYSLYDHNQEDAHPWSLVLSNPKENYTDYSPLHRTIFSYRVRDVYKRYGLNLTEFLELPREFVDLLLEASANEAKEDNATAESIANELGESIK